MFGLDYTWLSQPTYQSWLLEGLQNTLLLAATSSAFAVVIGLSGALVLSWRVPVASQIVRWGVELFRNTPPLLQMLFLYFALTQLGLTVTDPETGRRIPLLNSFACATFSLSLFGGASCIEVFRGGIDAVPRMTVEAARSLGYTRIGLFHHVQLPIAFRVCMPALVNVLVNLIKTTAEASVIAVPELMYYAGQIYNDNFLTLEVMLFVLITYVAIVSLAAFGLRRVEHALAYPGYGS
jgi:polar amino acid transport system permease protein